MRVVFRVTHDTKFEHVKAEAENGKATLEQFRAEIAKTYPDEARYYWRQRPSRQEHRDFDKDGVTIKFYARFSVPKGDHSAAKSAADVTTSRAGVYGFGED